MATARTGILSHFIEESLVYEGSKPAQQERAFLHFHTETKIVSHLAIMMEHTGVVRKNPAMP